MMTMTMKEKDGKREKSDEYVILVDGDDNKIGTEEKVRCHLPDGKLHRAFTALLFDENGRLAITRRSPGKMLWPGDWDGTFASHPREGETYVSSAERRMPEEMGLQCKVDYLFKFEYHAPYGEVGSENEICGTLIGTVNGDAEFDLIEDEISEMRWVSPEELASELRTRPGTYCPWMLIALYFLDRSGPGALEKYKWILESWTRPEIRERVAESIGAHLPESQWRLVGRR